MRVQNKLKNSLFVVIFMMSLVLATVNVYAADKGEDKTPLKKVRAGYLIYQGYQEGEGDEPKSGYGYEYLQQIAYYAGWEYEYVNGSFNELLEMLKKGEIDIMGNLSYTEERAKDISFAKEEQGREYYYLFVREDRIDLTATDPSTLQGARVGINKGSVQVEMFQKWCEERGVECQIELYESSAERYEDMNSGKLDATVSTTVAEKEIKKYHWNSIVKIGYSPYYFAVSKKNPELYGELNDAILKTLQSDWYYNEKVYLKYNGKTSASYASLDANDLEWLSGKSEIRIGYVNDTLPYADWDEEKHEMIGLLSTYIKHMKNRYDVDLIPIRFDSCEDMSGALQQGNIDAMFPTYGSYWIAEKNDLMITEPLTSSYLTMVYQNYYNEETTTSIIAVNKKSPMQQYYVQEHFPDSEMVLCDDLEECLNAVKVGKATCALMCSDTYYAYRNEYEDISDLKITNTGYEVPVSFATRRDNTEMYRFLKKGLASLDDKDVYEALIAEKYANPEMSVRQFLQKHILIVIVVFAIVLALVLTLFVYYVVSSRRALTLSKHNSELNEKAYIDLATGLPNRNKCEEMLASKLPISKSTACFMLDLNDLKKVNDTLGHEMGDMMILNFAKMLRKIIPRQYFVGRFGGDEFIVIAEEISGKDEAKNLVKEIREMIMKFNGVRGEFQISYACGVAYSEDYPGATIMDLLNEADLKMYEDKLKIKKEALNN